MEAERYFEREDKNFQTVEVNQGSRELKMDYWVQEFVDDHGENKIW